MSKFSRLLCRLQDCYGFNVSKRFQMRIAIYRTKGDGKKNNEKTTNARLHCSVVTCFVKKSLMILLRKILYTVACLLAFAQFNFAFSFSRFEFAEVHMGTQFKIILYAKDERLARRAAQEAFQRIARLDAIMSDYNEASELNRLCHNPPHNPMRISDDLFRILAISQQLAQKTDGAFDVTVGAVVRLWRRARRTGELPEADKIKQVLAVTGYTLLHLDAKHQSAWLEREGVLLDLGGIAKGYAADAASRVLEQYGIRSALVAAGGDIVVSGAPPSQRGWTIEIAPLKQAGQAENSIIIANSAVSTSGDTEQAVESNGMRYSHIVDPHTGIGLTEPVVVTVIAQRGVDADSLATAISVLGRERGLNFIDQTNDVAALLVKKTTSGYELFASKHWREVQKK
jgi:thiamine biosynthesis lipoprotein